MSTVSDPDSLEAFVAASEAGAIATPPAAPQAPSAPAAPTQPAAAPPQAPTQQAAAPPAQQPVGEPGEPVAPQAPQLNEFQQRMKGYGLSNLDKFTDEESLAKSYSELQSHLGKRDADAQYGRQMRTWINQQQQARAAAAAAQQQLDFGYQPDPLPHQQQQYRSAAQAQQAQQGAPQFNPAWANMVTLDPQSGTYVAKPGIRPEVAYAVNDYVEYRRQQEYQQSTNPQQTFEPLIGPMVDQRVQAALAAQQQQVLAQQVDQAAHGVLADIQDWAFEKDPTTGKPILHAGYMTPAGQRFNQLVQYAAQRGMWHPDDQAEYAKSVLGMEAMQAHQQMLRQRQAANGNGNAPPARPNPNLAAATHQPNATRPPQTGAAAELVREGESLEDAIFRAHREAGEPIDR